MIYSARGRFSFRLNYHRTIWQQRSSGLPQVNLGRFRLGDSVILVLVDWPQTVPPIAVITGPSGIVDSPKLSTRDGRTFVAVELLDKKFAVGDYTVQIGVSAGYAFTVVPGGDPAGSVISMHATKTVQGKLVVTQTRAGEILLGVNPRFT